MKILHHRLGARMNMQLLVDSAHVAAHTIHGDAHPVSDLLVKVAIGQQFEEILLTGRKVRQVRGLALGWGAKEPHHPAGDLGGHRGAAAMDFTDGLQQARRGSALEQVATRPSLEGFE